MFFSVVPTVAIALALSGAGQSSQSSELATPAASSKHGSVVIRGAAVPRYGLFVGFLVGLGARASSLSPEEFGEYLESIGLSQDLPCLPQLLSWQDQVELELSSLPAGRSDRARLLDETEITGELYGLLVTDLRRLPGGDDRVRSFLRYLTEVRAAGTTVRIEDEPDPFGYLEARQRAFWRGAAKHDVREQ
jgi:hypothetical protein